MKGVALAALLAAGWACDSGQRAAKPPAHDDKAPAPAPGAASAALPAPVPSRASPGSPVVPSPRATGTPVASATPAHAQSDARAPEGVRPPAIQDFGPAGAGTAESIEDLFPQRLEPSDTLSEARKTRIVKQLRSEREVPLTLQRIIVTPETNGAQDVYALYQYRLYASCADRPAECPAPEEVALNPDCRAHGVLHAHFAGGTGPTQDDGELDLVLMPLAEAACDLQVRHWFVAHLDGDDQLDAYLEVVSSQVLSKEASGKKPKVTTEHRQLLHLWSGAAPPNGADAEPSFFLELARWTVERWHQREPPVRESVVLFRGLQRQGEWGGNDSLDIIHLLPCLDPWSDDACDPELRRREVHSWGVPIDGE